LARERSALRHRRNSTSRDVTWQLDHARKSKPVHVPIGDDGMRAVIGNDATITWTGANGNFELNATLSAM